MALLYQFFTFSFPTHVFLGMWHSKFVSKGTFAIKLYKTNNYFCIEFKEYPEVSFSRIFFFFPQIIWFYSLCSTACSSTNFELECSDESHSTVKENLGFLLLWWYSHRHKNTVLEMLSLCLNRVVHCISALHNYDAKAAFTASLRLVTVVHISLSCIEFLCRGTSSVHYSPPVLVWLHSQTRTKYAVKLGIRTVIRSEEDLYPL